tara:strand:+ start:644 stop:913 length:270 start_codon:yes stop_codon:yes gene_type:complete
MTRYHLINGERVAFTAEEETARDAQEAAWAAEKAAKEYSWNRRENYSSIPNQLDQLYRDVAAGKFGEDAKTGEWFVGITSVKTANPKPS